MTTTSKTTATKTTKTDKTKDRHYLSRSERAEWARAEKIAISLRRQGTKGGAELAERILCAAYDATYGKRLGR